MSQFTFSNLFSLILFTLRTVRQTVLFRGVPLPTATQNLLLILPVNLLSFNKRIFYQFFFIEILPKHIYRWYLMIFIGCIIINSLIRIATRCVECNFELSIGNFTAASLLIYWSKDMEKLADARFFRYTGKRIHFGECDSYKSGCRW